MHDDDSVGEYLKKAVDDRDTMLVALRALEPYLDSKAQPGEMWASLCVRSTLDKVLNRPCAELSTDSGL